jgi:hypothetical protein
MKLNTTTIVLIVAGLGLVIGFTACSPSDLVKVTVPGPIVKELALASPTVPLSQLDQIQAAYADHVAAKQEAKQAEATIKAGVLTKAIAKSQRQWSAELERIKAAAAADLAAIQDEIDVTSAEAAAAQSQLANETKRTLATLDIGRKAAQEKADAIGSLLSGGLNLIAPALSTAVPGAGLDLTAIAGAVGLFTRKPGDAQALAALEAKHAAELKAAADAAWDQGHATAIATVQTGAAVSGKPPVNVPAKVPVQ